MLAENGVSVDLVKGVASIAGGVAVGKMFVDGLITGWNIAAERLFGRSVADSLGQLIRDALGVELDVVAIAAEGRARDLT